MKLGAISYIKSLGWGKKDVKNIIMLVVMLLISCLILNIGLRINITIANTREKPLVVDGAVRSWVGGKIDANVSEGIRCTIYAK